MIGTGLCLFGAEEEILRSKKSFQEQRAVE